MTAGTRGVITRAVCVVAVCATAALAHAEPPTVTALVPAGVRRGESIECKVVGKLGTRPVHVWCESPGLRFTVPEEGDTLLVEADASARTGLHWLRLHNAEGASSLRPFVVGVLDEVAETEPNDQLTDATALSVPVVVNGVLSKSGDVDGYAIELQRGRTLVAALAANTVLASPMDAVLQIVSPRGFVLAQNDDVRGFDPQLVFEAPHDGTFVVRAFAFPATPNSTIRLAGGTDYVYRLTLTTGPYVDHFEPFAVADETAKTKPVGWNLDGVDDDESPTPTSGDVRPPRVVAHQTLGEDDADGRTLEPPVSITGRIVEPGDVDEFVFAARKGELVELTVTARSHGFLLDAAVEVFDDAGTALKRADDGRRGVFDPVLPFAPPADGHYRVRVTDVFGEGGVRYPYELTIAPRRRDFVLTTTVDAFTLSAGGEVTIPVAIERRHGFDGVVTFAAEGLPDGVEFDEVTSEPKADTKAKVELVLKAKSDAVVGGKPFRIVGTSDELSGTATAPTPLPTRRTDAPWLTVTAAKTTESDAKPDSE